MPGLTFRETMAGWFSLDETVPQTGAQQGKQLGTKLTIRPTVTIDNLDRFICDEQHRGTLQGHIIFSGPFSRFRGTMEARTGRFNLFAPFGNTKRKRMIYELPFSYEGKDYYLAGRKEVEDDLGFDLWPDTTTLFTQLHEGTDRTGPVIGAGILRISLPGFTTQLFSMRITEARSALETLQGLCVFGQFFLVQLWDTYLKR